MKKKCVSSFDSPFFRTKFSHTLLLKFFFFTSSCISCTTWTRTGSACTRSRYENFIYHIVLSVSISRSFVVARFCLVFFSLCWNTQNNINFDREFIITKFTPRRPLIFFPNAWQKTGPDGKPTLSAHPARFSPDDKFSKQRVACKKRFGLLLTQQPEKQF